MMQKLSMRWVLGGALALGMSWQAVVAAPWSITFPNFSHTYGKAEQVQGSGPARRVEQSRFEFAIGTGANRSVDGFANITSTQPFPPYPMYAWTASITPPLLWWTVSPKVPPYNFYQPDHYTGIKDPDLNTFSWSGAHVVTN